MENDKNSKANVSQIKSGKVEQELLNEEFDFSEEFSSFTIDPADSSYKDCIDAELTEFDYEKAKLAIEGDSDMDDSRFLELIFQHLDGETPSSYLDSDWDLIESPLKDKFIERRVMAGNEVVLNGSKEVGQLLSSLFKDKDLTYGLDLSLARISKDQFKVKLKGSDTRRFSTFEDNAISSKQFMPSIEFMKIGAEVDYSFWKVGHVWRMDKEPIMEFFKMFNKYKEFKDSQDQEHSDE